jgi:hypothetical protein
MGELENLLPAELKSRATKCGNELLLPYADALTAVAVANRHRIGVLGIESFQIRADGLFATVSYTDYDRSIRFSGDWNEYVASLNTKAEQWIEENRLGTNHGYSLASTSEAEFQELQHFRKSR